jgi:peptide-methionine (R)-S-oxide reductase
MTNSPLDGERVGEEQREMTKDRTDECGKIFKRITELTDRQYGVTQQGATEPPFDNEFWDKRDAGIDVDVVSGEPLFASTNKYDGGSGWPSFTVPVEPTNVVDKLDASHGMVHMEVRSSHGGSHLGHVFNDGPSQDGGLRYCINSAALRFVPYDDLETQGYGRYKKLFEGPKGSKGVVR